MTSEQRYPHLSANAAKMADQPDAVRIAYMKKRRFVPYARAERILLELEMLYRMEDDVRPQGRLIVGRSLMGKSSILYQFLQNHRATDNPDGQAALVPVLSVQYPESAKEGIYHEILKRLHAVPSAIAKSNQIRADAVSMLQAVGCRLIIIDELHNLLEGSAPAQRRGLNSIKYLMNELGRPVVAAGTIEVLNAVRSDDQISSRLEVLPLKRFKDDEDFMELLAGFEMLLPLRLPSGLIDPSLSSEIHRATLGIIGKVSDLLTKAATLAIECGTERISLDEIRECVGENAFDIAEL